MLGRKLALLIVGGIVAVAVCGILIGYSSLGPTFHASPILRTRPLSDAEASGLLSRNFKVVKKVRQLPAAVKQSITIAWGMPFNMIDPEDVTDDAPTPSVPSKDAPERKMSFAGVDDPEAAFIIYEVNGFVDSNEIVLIQFGNDAALWCASFADSPPSDLGELRDAVAKHRFSPIPCRRPDNEMPKPRRGRGR